MQVERYEKFGGIENYISLKPLLYSFIKSEELLIGVFTSFILKTYFWKRYRKLNLFKLKIAECSIHEHLLFHCDELLLV